MQTNDLEQEINTDVLEEEISPNDYKKLLKAGLSPILSAAIRDSEMTQIQMQEVLVLPQSNISRFKKGNFDNCAEGRLLVMLLRLGFHVEIKLRPCKVGDGRLVIVEEQGTSHE